ncbi:MAG: hypothetical protein ABEH88_07540 [Halobacteriales archaeon]
MSYSQGDATERFVVRVGLPIVVSTAVFTLGFFGVLALVTGQTPRLELRVPVYAFGGAVTFVGAIVGLDQLRRDGVGILATAAGLSVVGFGILLLGGEGALYVTRNAGELVESRLFLYLIAAGLVSTGLAYWGIQYRDSLESLI